MEEEAWRKRRYLEEVVDGGQGLCRDGDIWSHHPQLQEERRRRCERRRTLGRYL